VRNEDDPRFRESVGISGYRRELARMELGMKRRFIDTLRKGPKTIPQVADELGITEHEAMWWMMGFVRYGYVTVSERANEEGYFVYQAAEGKG
jgi:predicted ArsR family transcriptional regulator